MEVLDLIGVLLLYVLLTLIIEVPVAYLLGFRKKDELLIVALASVVTNPVLNLFIIMYQSFFGVVTIYGVIALEILVVLVEFLILFYVFGKEYTKKKLLLLALIMNAASFAFGLLLNVII